MPSQRMKLVQILLLFVLAVVGAFLWGTRSARIQQVLESEPFVEPERPQRMHVESRSPSAEILRSLPYAPATLDPQSENRGTVLYETESAEAGLNFYCSVTAREAHLVDMQGRSLHRWSHASADTWQHAIPQPNGDLLVVVKDFELLYLDVRSRLRWKREGRFHHGVWVADGKIFALTREEELRPEVHPTQKTLVDYLVVYSMEGELLREFDLLELLQHSDYGFLLPTLPPKPFGNPAPLDILHANHVEILDGSLESLSPRFARGKALLSSRHLNAVFIADLEAGKIDWLWGPTNLTLPHHPSLLPGSASLILFDNGIQRSRILEIDALTHEWKWEYSAEDFFSRTRGSVQRLPGGNTLITESDPGYALEVTPQGRVVWVYANPDIDEEGKRSAIYRMTRFFPGQLDFVPVEVFGR